MALSRMMAPALLGLAIAALGSQAGHPPACPETACVREPAKVTHLHVAYRCKARTICLPFCKLCRKRHDCAAGCGDCGQPRQVRVLIKRFVKEHRCETPCVAKELPACPAPCGPAHGAVIHGATMLPPPKEK